MSDCTTHVNQGFLIVTEWVMKRAGLVDDVALPQRSFTKQQLNKTHKQRQVTLVGGVPH